MGASGTPFTAATAIAASLDKGMHFRMVTSRQLAHPVPLSHFATKNLILWCSRSRNSGSTTFDRVPFASQRGEHTA